MTGQELELRLVAGFLVMFSLTMVIDKAGDYLFNKGIAKPFYLLGYRLHHRNFLLALVPTTYVTVAVLIYYHYARVLWSAFWPSVEITILLAAICLTLDLALDGLSSTERRALLHHEWVYVVVPVYAFTHVVALV